MSPGRRQNDTYIPHPRPPRLICALGRIRARPEASGPGPRSRARGPRPGPQPETGSRLKPEGLRAAGPGDEAGDGGRTCLAVQVGLRVYELTRAVAVEEQDLLARLQAALRGRDVVFIEAGLAGDKDCVQLVALQDIGGISAGPWKPSTWMSSSGDGAFPDGTWKTPDPPSAASAQVETPVSRSVKALVTCQAVGPLSSWLLT